MLDVRCFYGGDEYASPMSLTKILLVYYIKSVPTQSQYLRKGLLYFVGNISHSFFFHLFRLTTSSLQRQTKLTKMRQSLNAGILTLKNFTVI